MHLVFRSALLAVVLLATPAASDDPLTGEARVVDGDTIEIDGIRLRLQGLHAPERGEPGGAAATRFMAKLLDRQTVRCAPTGERSYNRLIAVCNLDGGQDIAAELVSAGLGRDCARYSKGRYRQFETADGKRLPLPPYCER